MSRHIIVAITPDEDGVRCGECIGINHETAWACAFSIAPPNTVDAEEPIRGPLCLAAERKLAALIEAGNKFADREQYAHGKTDVVVEWDRAVADIRKGGE